MAAKTYEDFPFDELMTYAGVDTYVTYKLFKDNFPLLVQQPPYKQPNLASGGFKEILAPSVLEEALGIKKDALRFMVDLIVNGIQYDVQRNAEYDGRMRTHLAELEDSIFTKVGKKWNLNSDLETDLILFGEMGLKTDVKTKGGKPSLSGDALEDMYKKYELPFLRDMVVRNDVASVHTSFIVDYVSRWVKSDGRVHPNYNLHGTSSHRISGDKPNLLNIPSPKHGYNIRSLYGVAPGNVLLTFDYSSCEVKILAALCKDPMMLIAIEQGLDFHTYTAAQMYRIPYEEIREVLDREDKKDPRFAKYKAYRKNAKSVTFGLLFGSSVGGIAMNIGCTNDEAQKIIDSYFVVYPKIKEFVEQCHREAKLNKWIYTVFNQRKMEYGLFDMFKGTAVYNAALRNSQNVKIQSPASTLGLIAFSKFGQEIKRLGGKAICTVYDSLELEVPIPRLAEAIELGYACLDDYPYETFDWLDFKIGCDAEVGYNWGELSSVHRGINQEDAEKALRESVPC